MKRIATTLVLLSLSCSAALADNRASKIFTSDMAAKLLGAPVKDGMEMPDTEMGKIWVSRAHYSLAGTDKACGILIRHATTKDEAVSTFHESKTKFSGVTVAGLGDEAYRVQTPTPQLNVLKGQNWIIISAGPRKTGDDAMQEALAKLVVPKVDAQ